MNTMVLIPISIITTLVIAGIVMIVKSKCEVNKYKFEKQQLYDAIKPGSTFIFYGENGGGDPFTAEEHYIKVMNEKAGWVKICEEIYSSNSSKNLIPLQVHTRKKTLLIGFFYIRMYNFMKT